MDCSLNVAMLNIISATADVLLLRSSSLILLL